MRILATLSLASVFASGCTTVRQQPIDAKAGSSLKGQTVAATVHGTKPDFAAMTSTKAAFALIGAVVAISEGNKLVAASNIDDPAAGISSALSLALQDRYGAQAVQPAIKTNGEEIAQVVAAVGSAANYVVDVRTINWSLNYFATDWTHYRLIYSARARLIDTKTQQVVAEGLCKRIPETNEGAPTYDEMVGNNAARLKKELAVAAQTCVDSLKKDMLSI